MLLWQAIILAVVQGLTEFLPVSSSAHLILIPDLLHWPDPGLAFDVALHLGTLIAVLLYFFREWIQLTLCGLGFHYPKRASEQMVLQNQRLFWYLVAGTIPGALVGFFFEHWIEENLRSPIPIAGAMIAIALLMWYAEYSARLTRRLVVVVREISPPPHPPPRTDVPGRLARDRYIASSGAFSRRFALRHHHHHGPVPRHDARSRRPLLLPALDAPDRRSRRKRSP